MVAMRNVYTATDNLSYITTRYQDFYYKTDSCREGKEVSRVLENLSLKEPLTVLFSDPREFL
jgi:hypothetical protein